MLNKHELKHSSIKKEAAAIVGAVQKWEWAHFCQVGILVL